MNSSPTRAREDHLVIERNIFSKVASEIDVPQKKFTYVSPPETLLNSSQNKENRIIDNIISFRGLGL